MASRLQLQRVLEELKEDGRVYFQPPESFKLQYPCIIYKLSNGNTSHADNIPYFFKRRYQLRYVTRDPDDPLIDVLAKSKALSSIVMVNSYQADNLNQYIYDLYY